MNESITRVLFIVLNSSLLIAIAFWFIRYRIVPAIRASLNMQEEETTQLTNEISEQKTVLATAQQNYLVQEREIARLTSVMEKWAGVLSQRAATAEQETRELAFRYKARCEENARARVMQATNQRVTKQVLSNVRTTLTRVYADPEKQHQFVAQVCTQMAGKDRNGND